MKQNTGFGLYAGAMADQGVAKRCLGSRLTVGLASCVLSGLAWVPAASMAEPVTYLVDSSHTYPSFEADHRGLSLWRGKFNKTTGNVVLDRAKQTGTLEIVIEASSMDFGHDKMNEEAIGPKMLDSEMFPEIKYVGKSMEFKDGKPVKVIGELTMKDRTKPVDLTINHFHCAMHPFVKREVCGADAVTEINRSEFDVDYAVDKGFDPKVKVLISIEAIKQE